jgi:hypothetical protein
MEKIYVVEATEDDYQDSGFLFQGSKNWDLYFSEEPKGSSFEVINNVEILKFSDYQEFINALVNLSKEKFIDYSVEHVSENGTYYILKEK